MADTYNLREVRVDLGDGVSVVADVTSVAALSKLLRDLAEAELRTSRVPSVDPSADDRKTDGGALPKGESPAYRVEVRASIGPGQLEKANLLAFKDGAPQLLRPNAMSVMDALVVLLFAVETGLKRPKMDLEAFKGLYEAQNIKSGSPLRMRLTDMRNTGYLDKSLYLKENSLRLTAKGEQKAIEVLKAAITK